MSNNSLKQKVIEVEETQERLDHEITERKQAKKTLRESENRYRELADSLPETVIETDPSGNLTFANKNAFNIWGYTREEFAKGINIFQLVIPGDRDRARENFQRVLSQEELDGVEYTLLKKVGGTFSAIVYAAPIIKESKGVGLRGVVVDITERKRAEEALHL